jgi:ATP adenylyltransferase
MVCDLRLQEFIQSRNLAVWGYCLLELDPVPDDLRYQALWASEGRCAPCGAPVRGSPGCRPCPTPLPGQQAELASIQVRCAKCNRTKGNKNVTDFRAIPTSERDPGCLFCGDALVTRAVETHDTTSAILDAHPVTPGHHVVLPRQHGPDYYAMTTRER